MRANRFTGSDGASISPLLGWVLITGAVVWGAVVLWRTGLLAQLTAADPSYLSWVILLLYSATQVYAGVLALALHRDHNTVAVWNLSADRPNVDGEIAAYLARRADGTAREEEDFAYLRALVADRFASGWFIADLMFKLGLIGTVIGFILMLGAITDLRSMDIHQAQSMLAEMSAGMRLALYTTLTGLCCGALVGIQFHLLDRSADRLARQVAALAESYEANPTS